MQKNLTQKKRKQPRKKRRISSFDPDVNWETVKGADEEN